MTSQALQTKEGASLTRSLFSKIPTGICSGRMFRAHVTLLPQPLTNGELSLGQWLLTGAICLTGHLGQSGERERAASSCLETRDAAKHPTMHRTAPHNKALSSPECQQC